MFAICSTKLLSQLCAAIYLELLKHNLKMHQNRILRTNQSLRDFTFTKTFRGKACCQYKQHTVRQCNLDHLPQQLSCHDTTICQRMANSSENQRKALYDGLAHTNSRNETLNVANKLCYFAFIHQIN